MLHQLKVHLQDIRSFGPVVLERMLKKPNASGYTAVKTRFGTFFIRYFETDMQVLRQILIQREYDLDRFPQGEWVRSAYEDALRRGRQPLIIDAGGNAGFAARFFARAYPRAQIISVEPDPANAAICRANVEGLPQVEVVEAAIGSQPGHVAIEHNDGHAWATRTCRADAGVSMVTVGELRSRVKDSELLIVKVDIEGFELDLFSDATEWIAQTCAVIAEPHDWMLPGAGSSRTLQQAMLPEDREMLISGENLIWIKRQGQPIS
jgi:FkbM family methyltransferase